MTQEVVGLIGCPGSGKTTLANTYNPLEWVICTFDDLRAAMWPPHCRTYWDVRKSDKGDAAQRILHRVQNSVITSALENGFNVLSADTNVNERDANVIKELAAIFGIEVSWKLLEVPLHILQQRNNERDAGSKRVPDDILEDRFNKLWDNDAWWRSEPNVEIITYKANDLDQNDSPGSLLEKLIVDYPMAAINAPGNSHYRILFTKMIVEKLGIHKVYGENSLESVTQIVSKRFDPA